MLISRYLANNSDDIGMAKDSLRHAKHPIYLCDSEPVKDLKCFVRADSAVAIAPAYVWHQSLEAHVLDSSNIFRSLEVIAGT